MSELSEKNADQAASWNGRSGLKWTERQEHLDRLFAPVTAALFAAADIAPGMRVLDIGCGTGETALLAAERAGSAGRVLGLDISAPMLARARERTPAGAPLQFVEADATVYRFPPADADRLLSRFGVMFFAEPVAAFANMRRGLRPGARVVFACWRERRLNPYFTVPLEALPTGTPPPAEAAPDAPGPFAFADAQRVRDILTAAGYADIVATPVDLAVDLAAGQGLDVAVRTALEIGPASRLLAEQSAEAQRLGADAMRATLAQHQRGGAVPLDAAIWIITADNPA